MGKQQLLQQQWPPRWRLEKPSNVVQQKQRQERRPEQDHAQQQKRHKP